MVADRMVPPGQQALTAKPAEPGARPTLPEWRLGRWRVAVDVPHLLLVAAIGAWCAWFWYDSYTAAADIENLSLIEPVAILALLLCAALLFDCIHVRGTTSPGPPPTSDRKPLTPIFRVRLLGTMALLAVYVAIGPFAGFDIATFAYIFASLLFLGERRVWVLLLTPAIVCAIAIYCFNIILATPLPLF